LTFNFKFELQEKYLTLSSQVQSVKSNFFPKSSAKFRIKYDCHLGRQYALEGNMLLVNRY